MKIGIFLIFLTLGLPGAHSAEILKSTKKAVLVQFDPFEENFVVGDKLIATKDGKKQALIEITKIKGGKWLGQILDGHADPSMVLRKYDQLASDAPPSTSTANIETVTVKFASTYIWRGIPYDRPLILGSVDISSQGILGGLVVLNSGVPATSEYDVYLGYAFNHINWSITPMIAQYSFPRAAHFNTTDFLLTLTYRILSVDVSYMPDSFGAKSSDFYYGLGTSAGLGQRWKVVLHAGYSNYSKKENIGNLPYLDYKVAALYSTPEFLVEFAWTDDTRKDLAKKPMQDNATAVTISKQF